MSGYRQYVFTAIALILGFASAAIAGDNLKPEDVLQKHLDSLGTVEARTAAKSRVVEGSALYKLLVGGSGSMQGRAVFVSDGPKLQLLLKVPATQYRGEQFICNGDKSFVAATYSDKSRSEFGDFMRTQDVIMREGLLGGTLSTAWPLLNLDSRKARLDFQGLKKMDDRNLYAVGYRPKKNSDVDVMLYFDPETFRHVMTVYKVTVHVGIGRFGETSSTQEQEARYRIEERFADWQKADDLSLPSHYALRFTEELNTGFTKSMEWEVTVSRVINNVSVDAKNFEVK